MSTAAPPSEERVFHAEDVAAAASRIDEHVLRTPLFRSDPLSDRHGAEIFIKAEHSQLTGSFKVRGSANFVHALDASVAERGVVTASSGNHGIGVSTAARSRAIPARIFLPSNVSSSKLSQIERLGATPVLIDSSDPIDCERAARECAEAEGLTYISPYNDPLVAAGQGTIAKEILEQLERAVPAAVSSAVPAAVIVAVGGGGMISGIATWMKAHSPTTLVIGASAANDRAMAASIEAGTVIAPRSSPTFSDGTMGAIEDNTITFPICQQLVDEWIDVSEADIAAAVVSMIDDHHQLVEGSAGVAIAGATQVAARKTEGSLTGPIVAVSCGGNVSSKSLAAMISAEMNDI